MKKIATLSILLLLTATSALHAQTPYLDAKFISKYLDGKNLDFTKHPTTREKTMDDEITRARAKVPVDTAALATLIKSRQAIRSAKRDSVLSILVKYKIVSASDVGNEEALNAALHKNPFLEEIIFPGSTQAFFGPGAPNLGALVKSGISSLGGLDVTNIAEGISQFMISRAKEELTIAFFNRFKKCVEANPEIQVMFPKTTIALENLLDYHYPEMLPSLQEAFIADLDLLPIHLDDVLELPKYKELLKNFPEVRIVIHTLRIVSDLESKENHPLTIIHELGNLSEWDDPNASVLLENMGNGIRLGDTFSLSLTRDSSEWDTKKSPWITSKELKALVQDKTTFKIYLALVYQEVNHVTMIFPNATSDSIRFVVAPDTIAFGKLMAANKDNLILFQSKLSEFIQLAEKVKVTLEEVNTNKNTTPQDFHNYISQGIDVIEYCFDIAKLFNDDFVTSDYVKIARSGNDLYLNVAEKKYSAAITNAVDIFNQIQTIVSENRNLARIDAAHRAEVNTLLRAVNSGRISDEKIKKRLQKAQQDQSTSSEDLNLLTASLAPADMSATNKQIVNTPPAKEGLAKLTKVIPEISKYGRFIANVASAETPAEVEQIIEAAVLPVGSSSIKKNSEWNLAVQSYLGAYYLTSNRTTDVERAWSDKFGVIAPIGIGMSYGLRKGGSFTLFASLLDLGAIVDYKLKYDSVPKTPSSAADVKTSKSYEVKLGQIFSPGGYLIYGLPWNLPLSLGFGAQYGPGLSSIDESGNTVVDNPYWRWNAFLAVDIPLFNIYNKERRFEKRRK
ncbi:hypothetical protein [Chryseolinea lacunae]|uniref:Outer membrane protein beta-barrel domain-containing protein n=1 Tax=Chryseolinea lacunae TaxID=2801331 RepID=A0ABS1KRI9_9BACT|nr:hypothetical protein [Chryseolinea lacunae]MBL0741979.1 hypothetical protein [Chryseolinea lacunae]